MFNCFQIGFRKTPVDSKTFFEKKQFNELEQSISNNLIDIRNQVIICDKPIQNRNGMIDYKYTIEREANRKRRVEAAKKCNLSISDAPFSQDFFKELVCQILSSQTLFGQCGELAMVAAEKVKVLAELHGLNVYTIQIPNANHTVVLLSKTVYSSKQFVNWEQEYKKHSVIVDLWQAALTPEMPNALISFAQNNIYTRKKPKALVQLKV